MSCMGRGCIERARVSAALVTLAWALAASSPAARAADHRFFLASQYRWDLNRGFLLELQGSAQSGAVAASQVRLVAMVGDGNAFHTMEAKPLELNKRYAVTLEIGPAGAKLLLDGKLASQTHTGFVPFDGAVALSELPSWAAAPANYDIVQGAVTLRESGPDGHRAKIDVGDDEHVDPALLAFNQADVKYASWTCRPERTLTIATSFQIVAKPDLKSLVPLVDRYGQFNRGTWPGKVTSDDQLHQALREENRQLDAWGVSDDFDRYGGYRQAGWHETAKGFYGVVKHNGFWWLVSPEGNPCFYTGLDTLPSLTWDMTPVTGRESVFAELPPKEGPFAAAWGRNVWGEPGNTVYVGFTTANLIRKFGPTDWQQQARQLTARRLKAWGFSGAGKWGGIFGDGARLGGLDDAACVGYLTLPGVTYIGGKPDVFDPVVRQQIRTALTRQITPQKDNPWVLGWGVGNEYGEIVTADDVRALLASSGPGKRALVDYAVQQCAAGDVPRLAARWHSQAASVEALYQSTVTPPAEDLEKLREYFADHYYATLYDTCKAIDSNHLYLGSWIVPGWWVNEEDWRLLGRHCDVIGYDLYKADCADPSLERLMRETDKPAMVGEFSFTPVNGGQRGYAGYKEVGVADDAAAGAMYTHFVGGAARDRYCIGTMWFQYRDESVSGRGPGSDFAAAVGEHYAFGLVDITDTPKWDLVRAVRQANLEASAWRQKAAASPAPAPSSRMTDHK